MKSHQALAPDDVCPAPLLVDLLARVRLLALVLALVLLDLPDPADLPALVLVPALVPVDLLVLADLPALGPVDRVDQWGLDLDRADLLAPVADSGGERWNIAHYHEQHRHRKEQGALPLRRAPFFLRTRGHAMLAGRFVDPCRGAIV